MCTRAGAHFGYTCRPMDTPERKLRDPHAFRLASALVGVLLALCISPVLADNNAFIEKEDVGNQTYDGLSGFDESEIELPPFPVEKDLLKVQGLDSEPYDLYLDRSSIVVDKNGVLRLSVLLHAAGGSANIFHEGVRCATREFKTYAYGTRDGRFRAFRTAQWKDFRKMPRIGVTGYRRLLAETYLCDTEVGAPLRIRDILSLARAMAPRSADERLTRGTD